MAALHYIVSSTCSKGRDDGFSEQHYGHRKPCTTNLDIQGLDDIQVTLNVPDPITTNSTSTTTSSLAITQPIQSDTSSQMAITQPIVMDTTSNMTLDVKPLSMELDVKPVVMDLCVTLKLADLPTQQVRRPYERFYGLTLLGRVAVGLRMERGVAGHHRGPASPAVNGVGTGGWCGPRRPVFTRRTARRS